MINNVSSLSPVSSSQQTQAMQASVLLGEVWAEARSVSLAEALLVPGD
jgi:hypothetical protein